MNLTAGVHTLTFQGSGNGTVFLDDIQVQSVAAMYASGVQDITSTVRSEVDWDMAYGLQTVGYEGGFDVGGDNPSAADYAANVDPQASRPPLPPLTSICKQAAIFPLSSTPQGGPTPWPPPQLSVSTTSTTRTRPNWLPTIRDESALPVADNNTILVPGVLTPANMTMYYSDSSGNPRRLGWWALRTQWLVSWNIDVTFAGTYTITTATTGAGGSYVMLINEVQIASGSSGGNVVGSVTLSPGYYDLKIRSTSNTPFQINQVTVALNKQAPAITSAPAQASSSAWPRPSRSRSLATPLRR